MAQQIAEDRYLVIEHDRTTKKPKAPRLVSNLVSFRKKYMPFGTDEHFLADCESGRTAGYGLQVRKATKEDIEKHGGDSSVLSAAESYAKADAIAQATKLEAARTIIPFIVKAVESEEDLINAMNTYNLSTTQLMAMAKDVRPEGIEVPEDFVDIYCQLVSDRAKKAGTKTRSRAAVRADWDKGRKAAKTESDT